jgi:integrase
MPLKLVPPRKGWSPYYRVRGSHLGVRVDRSTKARDVKTARRIRDKWKRQIERGEFAVSGEATFASAARDYMKAGGDPRPIGPLLDFFLDKPLSQIDQKAIDAAAIALYPGDDISPATRNREVYTPISAVLKHAGFDFKIRRPKGSRGRVMVEWLWPEQAFRLFTAATTLDPEFGILLQFLCYTGCRLGEALSLACNNVRLAESFAFVRTSKNGDPRAVFLPPELVGALANHPKGLDRKEARVFRFHQGGALRWLLNAAKMTACGLEKPRRVKGGKTPRLPEHELEWVTFHTFCHTWATWMRRYGGLDTKGLVGTGRWRDEQSASRYQHVVVSEESRRAELLPIPKAKA